MISAARASTLFPSRKLMVLCLRFRSPPGAQKGMEKMNAATRRRREEEGGGVGLGGRRGLP